MSKPDYHALIDHDHEDTVPAIAGSGSSSAAVELLPGYSAVDHTVLQMDLPQAPPIPDSTSISFTKPQVDDLFASPDDGLSPPGYFNVSNLPTQQVLMRAEAQTPFECLVGIERTSKGVRTHDSVVASNPDALFDYFIYYIDEKPTMLVEIRGTHKHTRTETRTVSNGNGGTRTETTTHTDTIIDFCFTLDASHYVAPTWDRIVANPKRRVQEPELGEWRAVMEQFTRSTNPLKEIHMKKEIVWDFEHIKTSIKAAIRCTGYFHDIHVSFPKANYKVSAMADTDLSHFANSTVTRVLCFLSCLWIIFLPLFLIVRKNVTGQLYAYYQCVDTGRSFYDKNVGLIMNAVLHREKRAEYRAL
ncbi:hypothetical protein BC830DRAFT_1138632 [Chytriomyces sp. MP71]|nr:hypothetical protein BC830DRAFT_1138632 [Chytriomyces sp. MP71]